MILPEIDPIALQIGPLAIRWYSLTWIAAFLTIYYLLQKSNDNLDAKRIEDLMFYGILGAILGGRFGYMSLYGTEELLSNPISIFYIWQGGLSFHGGLIGVLIACYILSRKWKVEFFWLMDKVAPCIPPGLGLVRIGNFLNSELLGRPTTSSWGVIFPSDPSGLLRHPSQLYQAFAEGIILFIFLMWISRKPKPTMNISGYFLIGYGILRFLTEFFRTPDAHIGFVAYDLLTRGQILCIPMIAIGVYLIYYSHKINKLHNETVS